MRAPKIERYRDRDGLWNWRLIGANGERICRGESHPSKGNATRAFRRASRIFNTCELKVVDAVDKGRQKPGV